jgi:hypothetical protein
MLKSILTSKNIILYKNLQSYKNKIFSESIFRFKISYYFIFSFGSAVRSPCQYCKGENAFL